VSASRGRRRRAKTAAVAKARRQRNLAIAGALLFAIVLAIQLPRILNRGDDSTAAGDTTAVTTTAATPTTTTPEAGTKPSAEFQKLTSARPDDPFGAPATGNGDPPPGKFTTGRDPFVGGNSTAAAPPRLPARIVLGTPRAGSKATVGYIVVLASVPTRAGRRSADRIAGRARNRGVEGVAVLRSSTKKSLRAGYFVVYVGSYKTQGAALAVAAGLHVRGFGDAYIREIVRY